MKDLVIKYLKLFIEKVITSFHRYTITRINLITRQSKVNRKIEIGPGVVRIPEFETLNVVWTPLTDYVLDASKALPFKSGTFELVYASHILEHIPWYHVESILAEWIRILKPNGALEVWVPDGLKICKAWVDAELNGDNYTNLDGWWRFNESKDACRWASGRIFSYGDGAGTRGHFNWHSAVFSFRYLSEVFARNGLTDIRPLSTNELRGYDHGWINLGIKGIKR